MSRVLGTAVAILTTVQFYVSAQAPPCLSGIDTFLYNHLNQTPCTMTLALGEVCQSDFSLAALQQGFLYLGPQPANANACRCSSVFYSLLSACALCQGQTYLSWSSYKTNCSNIYLEVFEPGIPDSTQIPHYAYLNVTLYDGFNLTAAQGASNFPESTFVPQATTTSASATSTSAVRSSKSKAGPIAGGVIGGVVFVAILGLIAWVILRRRKPAPKIPPIYNSVTSPSGVTDGSNGNMRYNNSTPMASMASARIYDPNDPSTFPTNDPLQGYIGPSPDLSQRAPVFTGNSSVPNVNFARSQYTGAPEVS